MREGLKFSGEPQLRNPSLVVGWSVDASGLGARVTDYLARKLGGRCFCEIDPAEFFPLAGVTISDDLVQFPESKFYACPEHDLLLLCSTPPSYEWYRFLNLILDVAGDYCHAREMYVIGGMVSLGAHTAPRELMGTFNSPELKASLSRYNLAGEMNYETPPGQRPTLNSFLLWVARRRSLPAVTLWVPIPFYLVAVDDVKAQKRVVELLDERLRLGIDFTDLDEEIRRQNEIIAQVRNSFPDLDDSISKLERNVMLSAEENQNLVQEIERFLRQKRD